jgi:hypothetical protein
LAEGEFEVGHHSATVGLSKVWTMTKSE